MTELVVMTAAVDPRLVPAICRVWEVSREGKKLTLKIDSVRGAGFRLHHGVSERELVSHEGLCEGLEVTVKLKGDESEDVWFTAHPFAEVEHPAVEEVERADVQEKQKKNTAKAKTPRVEATADEVQEEPAVAEVPVTPKRPRFVTLGGEGLKVR